MNHINIYKILISCLVLSCILLYRNYKYNYIIPNNLYITNSNIIGGGRGMFTNKPIKKGTFLFPTLNNKIVTPPGAMINHCNNPNTAHYIKIINGCYIL